ncbi:MAG: DUF4253 domain-containing protein [Verrucomicrobia bacterium]|nr:DUF4253 domain-containing protein [Verrucomicrobiota bacterium]
MSAHRSQIPGSTFACGLYTAFCEGDAKLVSFLLANGADMDAPVSINNDTPLMMAACDGMADIVADLIKRGANLEKHDLSAVAAFSGVDEGDTALIKAVRSEKPRSELGRVESIKLLVGAGVNVNTLGEGGQTALDRAGTAARNAEIRKLLLAAGAKSAKELRPAKVAHAAPKPKPSKPVDGITNFSQASALLTGLCGSKPQAHPQIAEAQFFQFRPAAGERAPIGKALVKRLERIRREAAPQIGKAGCWVVRTHELNTGLGLCLLRAKDKFAVVKQFNFGSGNYGVTTTKAITFLRALDRTAPFTLLACDKSALAGRFQALPKSGLALAKSLHGFCPFVCDDFDDDVKALARHLEKGGEFTLWWD